MGQTALLPLRRTLCSGFLSPLKIHRPRSGSNPRTLGPVASTLITTILIFITAMIAEVNYRLYKSISLAIIVCQFKPIYILVSYFLKSNFNISAFLFHIFISFIFRLKLLRFPPPPPPFAPYFLHVQPILYFLNCNF
jgi:hypothetical protein